MDITTPPPKNLLTFAPREFRGSRFRCLLLTSTPPQDTAEFLTQVAHPFATVTASDIWAPKGFGDPDEIELHNASRFPFTSERKALDQWWLAVPRGERPNWDLVSTCVFDNRPGLMLVEAKSHVAELGEKDQSGAAGENKQSIEKAFVEANTSLQASTSKGWNLGFAPHYQLSNRFAFAWKMAQQGVPVVLVYLGFTNAIEMQEKRTLFSSHGDWERRVRDYSRGVVPDDCWGVQINVPDVSGKTTPMVALIRSMDVRITASAIQ